MSPATPNEPAESGSVPRLQGLAGLLPAPAVARGAPGVLDGACLLPEEDISLGEVCERRRQEFTVARTCARAAMAELGLPPSPILSGWRREPLWPDGIVGSITHCRGYAAAAVAPRTHVATVGIDAEPHAPIPDGVLDHIASPREQAHLAELGENSDIAWDRVMFSAKESVYKAWYPLTGRWLGFDDAYVRFDAVARTFRARFLVPPPVVMGTMLTGFDGRFAIVGDLVLTAVVLPVPLVQFTRQRVLVGSGTAAFASVA